MASWLEAAFRSGSAGDESGGRGEGRNGRGEELHDECWISGVWYVWEMIVSVMCDEVEWY